MEPNPPYPAQYVHATPLGQILPSSVFGDLLTQYAREAENIVELGTFGGEGSTLCLQLGMKPGARLWSVEIDPQMQYRAQFRWHDHPNMAFLLGRVSDTFDEFQHPDGEPARKTLGYDFSREQFFKAPNVLDCLPAKIDLLLIDAGEWSATGEMAALIDRCTIICLDDTNPTKAHKNVRNRSELIRLGWETLHDDLNDRNGCGIWRRPTPVAAQNQAG